MAAGLDFATRQTAGTPTTGAELNANLVQKDTTTGGLVLGNGTKITAADIGALTQAVADGLYLKGGIEKRQCILSAPTDTNGFTALGGSTGATTVTTTAISASVPMVVTSANGYDANGAVNTAGISTANLSWTGLSTNGTMYLYVDEASGVLTTGSTTLAPVYQRGGAYSTVSGQATFNISDMKMKVGDGTSAVQTNRVFVGQVTVAGGVVSTITWYALKRQFRSTEQNVIDATGVIIVPHYLGCKPENVDMLIRIVTAQHGWNAGDEFVISSMMNSWIGVGNKSFILNSDVDNVGLAVYSHTLTWLNKTTGAIVTFTAANIKYVFKTGTDW